MYESYSWPGAYSLKDEMKLLIGWFKKILSGIHKEIKEVEKKAS